MRGVCGVEGKRLTIEGEVCKESVGLVVEGGTEEGDEFGPHHPHPPGLLARLHQRQP